MTYYTKVRFFVDLEKVPDGDWEWLGHLYSMLREIIAKLDGTFDCFHLDNVNSDKIEIEFKDPNSLARFVRKDAYKYLEEVLADWKVLLKREAKSKKVEAGD